MAAPIEARKAKRLDGVSSLLPPWGLSALLGYRYLFSPGRRKTPPSEPIPEGPSGRESAFRGAPDSSFPPKRRRRTFPSEESPGQKIASRDRRSSRREQDLQRTPPFDVPVTSPSSPSDLFRVPCHGGSPEREGGDPPPPHGTSRLSECEAGERRSAG